MMQEIFPEIQAATEALETRIRLTEAEIAEMKDSLKKKKTLVRAWRKALSAFSSRPSVHRKKVAAKA
jgi:DNA/RNA-binding domain of Phe-tRNA-synthetase-like protein